MHQPLKFEHYTARINQLLRQHLPEDRKEPTHLHRAMRYSVLNNGKRIRPLLTYATAELLNISKNKVDIPAIAIELIHAYSLIHDDLPAMDDDDLRRGVATCHKEFDEATAILAGDALQSLAFHLITNEMSHSHSAEQQVAITRLLSFASGSLGMAGGQALDLRSTGKQLSENDLETIHNHKTGALIRCAILMAWHCSKNQDPTIFTHLDHYASCIGLAFQVRDDILDIESNTELLGKQQGKDKADNKATYPALLGMNTAKQKTLDLCKQAFNHLNAIAKIQGVSNKEAKNTLLYTITHYIISRVK